MKRELKKSFSFHLSILSIVFIWACSFSTANEIRLPATTTAFLGRTIDLDVQIITEEVVQGFQIIADWDGAVLQGINIDAASGAGEVLEEADTIVSQIDSDYFIVAVVMDTDPFDEGSPEEIPVGTHRVATVSVQGLAEDSSTDITFRDDTYGTSELGPKLSNLLVINSLAYGESEGLILTSGTVNVLGVPPGKLRVEDFTSHKAFEDAPEQPVAVKVMLDSSGEEVQAYVLAVQHDEAIVSLLGASLDGTDAAANSAEFVFIDDSFQNGALIAVVMDYDPPFDDQNVSGTADSEATLATLTYQLDVPRNSTNCGVEPPARGEDIVTNVTLVDGVFGDPAQENIIVIAGLSKNPELVAGTLTFPAPGCPPTGFISKAFAAGGDLVRVDRGADGSFTFDNGQFVYRRDAFDNFVPDSSGAPAPLEAGVGEAFPVNFYYTSPLADNPGGVDQGPGGNFHDGADDDDPQAVSMAAAYDRGLSCLGTYSVEGTVTQAVGGPGGAEFVNVSCEDTDNGGSIVIAIQVELTPSNGGGTLPPTSDWLKLVAVDFTVNENAACGQPAQIRFQDGVDGGQNVGINNVFAINNFSVPAENTAPAIINIGREPVFIRGDANYDGWIDIADSVAIISSLFLTGVHKFELPCKDSADVNDDARIDLADSIFELNYLFKSGRAPLYPFPEADTDPTDDELDCIGGRACD